MWIFFRDSFLSVVRHDTDDSMLLVRARVPGDIERVFPDASVEHTPGGDYAYRAAVNAAAVASAVAKRVESIDYITNFKGGAVGADRHDAYMKVWSAMARLQRAHRGNDRR
jgi:hypothetical protein